MFRFRFRHELMREYLYRNLGNARRQILHARVGDQLCKFYGTKAFEIGRELALHFFNGARWDLAQIFAFYSGVRLMQKAAYREAAANFKIVLNALDHWHSTPEEGEFQEDFLIQVSQLYECCLFDLLQKREPIEIQELQEAERIAKVHLETARIQQQYLPWEEAPPDFLNWIGYDELPLFCGEAIAHWFLFNKRLRDVEKGDVPPALVKELKEDLKGCIDLKRDELVLDFLLYSIDQVIESAENHQNYRQILRDLHKNHRLRRLGALIDGGE